VAQASTTADRHPPRGTSRAALACTLACLPALTACSWMSHGQNAEGVRMFEQGHYQGAIQRFQQAMATDPNNADGYYNLAAAYHRTGKLNNKQEDLDQAESFYNQCLDHDLDHRDCYRGLAVLLVEQQRTEEAFRLLEGWSSRSPTSAAARVELARLAEEFGRFEQAKEHLLEALTIDPYDARALAALGRLHETAGNQTQALADYERSLWHDRFQPEVAARISSLRAAVSPAPMVTPLGGTRTVNINPATGRL
jgi:tetratricopeptide (TPR) repeat protein